VSFPIKTVFPNSSLSTILKTYFSSHANKQGLAQIGDLKNRDLKRLRNLHPATKIYSSINKNPYHPENMDAKRHGDLLDDPFSTDKNGGAISDQRRDQSPKNHSHREKGQICMDILMEQLRIEKSHGQDGNPQTQGDPERSE